MNLIISLQPEVLFHVGGFPFTNTLLVSILVTLFVVAMAAGFRLWGNERSFVYRLTRYLLFSLLKVSEMVLGDRARAMTAIPLVATFFVFIVLANLLALLPGFLGSFYLTTAAGEVPILRSPNSDLNTTLALSLVAVVAAQVFSVRHLGWGGFVERFVNLKGPIRFFMGFFEIISEFAKVLSFSFRLFGNVFAGEILLLVIGFLVPFILPVPFMALEVFVGLIQALIFSMLSLTFIKTASVTH